MKLVFDYTYCSEPECWEQNIPFEYSSKEKFIFDVLENPMLLTDFGVFISEFQIEDGSVFKQDYIENLDNYILTLEEWFEKNKITIQNRS